MVGAMQELKLIPYFSCPLRGEGAKDAEIDLNDHEISTHYETSINRFYWDDDVCLSAFKAWALREYGESIREYDVFALCGS
jgi:hypothetical protein